MSEPVNGGNPNGGAEDAAAPATATDDSMEPKLMAILVGIVSLVILAMFMRSSSNSNTNSNDSAPRERKLPSSSQARSTPKTSKAKKNKKKAKAKKSGNSGVVGKAEPPPSPVKEEEVAPPPAVKKQKEEKKESPAAVPATAKTQKKKTKKKKNGASSTRKSAAVDDDDEDDMMEQAAFLMAMTKKGKGGKSTKPATSTSSSSAATTNGKATNGTTTTTSGPSKKKSSKANAAATTSPDPLQPAPEVLLDIGPDPFFLIGTGGSTIQNITATSGARLDILKNAPSFGQNRVRITAPDGDDPNTSIAKAVEMVQALLDEQAVILANSKTITLTSTDINGQAGVKAIIGRKGETIQSILQKCNHGIDEGAYAQQLVKINANIEAATVEVSGPKALVDRAVKMCKQAVFGETQSTMKLQSRSAMNIVFGKDFRNIQELQATTGAKLDMEKETFTLKFSGKSEEVAAAQDAVAALLEQNKGTTMDIKVADIGAVYGKGGSTIRNIQDKTNTFIEVEQQPSAFSPEGEPAVKCTIMGEADACTQARKLIEKAMSREVELKPGQIIDTVTLGGAATAAVIGKGGSKIKELELTHNVSVNVNDEVCRIVGKEANVKEAKAAIKVIVDPILAVEEAQRQATIAAEAGDSAWQAYEIPPELEGW